MPGVIVNRGASATVPLGPPSARLAPGDAIGAALSFGDFTVAAIGTTTYVCGGQAVAFGHSFLFTGPTVIGATRARVLGIVADPTLGPIKRAILTEPVGIVDRDRFSAIRARFGAEIPTIPVTQDTTALDTGNQRLGARTDVVGPTGTPIGRRLFAEHRRWAQRHQHRSDLRPGIRGERRDLLDDLGSEDRLGAALRAGARESLDLARGHRVSQATDELFVALDKLASQDFEPIEFTGLAVDDVSVERTVRRYRIERVLWARNARRFADVERLRVRRGDTVRARIELRALDDGSLRTERMSFRVPGGRRRGVIQIAGGAALAAEEAGERRRGGGAAPRRTVSMRFWPISSAPLGTTP